MSMTDILGQKICDGDICILFKSAAGLLLKKTPNSESQESEEYKEYKRNKVFKDRKDNLVKKIIKNLMLKYRETGEHATEEDIAKEISTFSDSNLLEDSDIIEIDSALKKYYEVGPYQPGGGRIKDTNVYTDTGNIVDDMDEIYRDPDTGVLQNGIYKVKTEVNYNMSVQPIFIKVLGSTTGIDKSLLSTHVTTLQKLKIFYDNNIEYAYESDLSGSVEFIKQLIQYNNKEFLSGSRKREISKITAPVDEEIKKWYSSEPEEYKGLSEKYDSKIKIYDKKYREAYDKLLAGGKISKSEIMAIKDTELFKSIYEYRKSKNVIVDKIKYVEVDPKTLEPIQGTESTVIPENIIVLDKVASEDTSEQLIKIAVALEMMEIKKESMLIRGLIWNLFF